MFGFPVRITPWFWIAGLLLGLSGDSRPESVLLFIPVVLVSILVHELGHAFAIRYFGDRAHITLYHFGGLAAGGTYDRPARDNIIIFAAGPAAGLLLAGLVVAVLAAMGRVNGVTLGLMPIIYKSFAPIEAYDLRDLLIWDLLFVNFAWSFINLLPVYPLDGGQINREILVELNPSRGIVQSLWVSIVVAGAFAVYALIAWRSLFVPIMFALLAFSSYRTLQQYQNQSYGPRW